MPDTLDSDSQWVLDRSQNIPDQEGDGGKSRIRIDWHMSGLTQKLQQESLQAWKGAPVDRATKTEYRCREKRGKIDR